jgi:YidC/Oxa1 family membrane protein insertase
MEGQSKPTWLPAKGWQRIKTKAPEGDDSQSLSFEMKVYRGSDKQDAVKHPYLRLTKTYTVRKNDYTVQVTLRVENLSDRPLKVGIDQRGPTGVPREDRRSDLRFLAWGQLAAPKQAEAKLRAKGKLSSDDLGRYSPIREITDNKPILWVGQTNKFFVSVLYLRPEITQRLQAANYQPEFYYGVAMESDNSRTPFTGVKIPSLALGAAGKSGAVKTLTFDLFAGPKKRAMFDDAKAELFKKQYKDLNYLDTIHFGACFFTIPLLTFGMMRLLNVLSMVALGNYGVAIILLVTLVRLVLHPLTKRSQVSMMKMQKMAPQIAKLKEKYANDKETLNKEMMRVYKEQGTKPLLGCLPMLLQMPIWIALFTGLNAAVELRHAAFLPVWITDLTAPDALIEFGRELPLLGASLNLLPILLTVAMFLQTKINPQMAGATSPDQQKSQSMMKYMMPGMMLVFFYQAPSGLTLYIMASTTASVLEQVVIRKHIREKEAAEAAAVTTVHVPGKGFRDSRPKKSKGPNWTKRPW